MKMLNKGAALFRAGLILSLLLALAAGGIVLIIGVGFFIFLCALFLGVGLLFTLMLGVPYILIANYKRRRPRHRPTIQTVRH